MLKKNSLWMSGITLATVIILLCTIVLFCICRGGFSIDFKTTAEDGMIVYMANERQIDFIALYMRAGRIVYMFNCGGGPARLTSAGAFNDGEWHTVRQTIPSHFTESQYC